jgi:hypothetical protein
MTPAFRDVAGRNARDGYITQNGTEAKPPWSDIPEVEREAWRAFAQAVCVLNSLNVGSALPLPVPYVDRFQTACMAVSNMTPDMGAPAQGSD